MASEEAAPKQPRRRYKKPSKEMVFLNESPKKKERLIRSERHHAREWRSAYIQTLGSIYGYQCLCCGATIDLTLDHIRPVSLGGRTELDNLQILCHACNQAKANQTIDYRGTLP